MDDTIAHKLFTTFTFVSMCEAMLSIINLCSSVWVWATGTIPQQMCWVITVLILKGGGEYWGIGLLKPIWKVLEKVMDLMLETIVLHDSLHRCLAMGGMGTGITKTKLAQQLAHLE
jgi:hypothetical protein